MTIKHIAFATTLGMLSSASSHAACKKARTETDPFSQAVVSSLRVSGTGALVVSGEKYMDWVFTSSADGFSLQFHLVDTEGLSDTVAPAGTQVLVALDGHEPISFATESPADPVIKVSALASTTWTMTSTASRDTIATLAEFPPVAVKTEFSGRTYELELPGKTAKKLSQAATCMLE